MFEQEDLYRSPNRLAAHYRRFAVDERLLLTGHSHQAWPDCGFEGQKQAWLDAARHVDDKWERAFEKADTVRRWFGSLLDDEGGHIALSSNTHDLVVRFLSALPLADRPRLVTTDGEYHSIRRQLDRLAEEGIEIQKVAAHPAATVAERLTDAVDDHTAAVLVSSVYYRTGHIVRRLAEVLAACRKVGSELLVDAYHSLNVVPFSLKREGLEGAFVVGGGYKYCQLGEGNCFLHIPADCRMRPVVTGWFSEFTALADTQRGGKVGYGRGGDRFAGSTYDPTSHYRAAEVVGFFTENALGPEFLRTVSQHQMALLADRFDGLDLDAHIIDRDRSVGLEDLGGFLSLSTPHAGNIAAQLRERGVFCDYRGDTLRLGPAPYLSDRQIIEAVGLLGEVVRSL